MKAEITKGTIERLYNVSTMTKIMILERNVRISALDGYMRFGTTLKDIPDDFSLPLTNLPVFLKMCESAMGKTEKVYVEYSVEEREIGLDVKKLFTVNITDGFQQTFNTYECENEEFKAIKLDDISDKSKIDKMPEDYIAFKLDSASMKLISKNANILSADTLIFKKPKKDRMKCKIYSSRLVDPPYFDFVVEDVEHANCEEFPMSIPMLNVIDNQIDYKVVINCNKNAILFANEESGTFYITSSRKTT